MKKWMMIALVALFATAMNSQAWWIFGKKAAAPASSRSSPYNWLIVSRLMGKG